MRTNLWADIRGIKSPPELTISRQFSRPRDISVRTKVARFRYHSSYRVNLFLDELPGMNYAAIPNYLTGQRLNFPTDPLFRHSYAFDRIYENIRRNKFHPMIYSRS